MSDFIQAAVLVPLFLIFYQFYSYSISSTGVERQKRCLTLGVVVSSLGVTGLAFHSITTVFGGIILIMMGFRLLAYGLDRIDKKISMEYLESDDIQK